jgi:hypothetical protein
MKREQAAKAAWDKAAITVAQDKEYERLTRPSMVHPRPAWMDDRSALPKRPPSRPRADG